MPELSPQHRRRISLSLLIVGLSFFTLGPLGPCACRTPLEPSMAPTPVPPTPTPAPVATRIIYDGETVPTRLCGGCTWVSPNSGSPQSSFATGPAYAHTGAQGLRLNLAWPDPAWYGGMGYNWGGWVTPANAVNTTLYDRLEFWIRGVAGGEQGVNIILADTANRGSGQVLLVPAYLPAISTAWQRASIPLADIPWGTASPSAIWEIQFATGYASAGSAAIEIDEVRFADY